VVRIGYFKVATKDAKEPLSTFQVRDLVEKYAQSRASEFERHLLMILLPRWVHRNDEELSRMQRERRPGRPSSTKEDQLKLKIDREMEEYRTGFYMPDLQDWTNIEWLQRWDGNVGGLAQIRFTRITKEDSPSTLKMEF
jgi:translation machinery-associated protein 16